MTDMNFSMLRKVEATFQACAFYLFDEPVHTDYLDQVELLSRDARRLSLLRICRYCFPDFYFTAMPGWDGIHSLAESMEQGETKPLGDLLPPLWESKVVGKDRLAHLLSEIGFFYERLKDFDVRIKKGKLTIQSSSLKRKRTGTYFTPLSVCEYMVQQALGPFLKKCGGDPERILEAKIIDPAMGTGQFLLAAAERFIRALAPTNEKQSQILRQKIFTHCLFGIELDRENAEIARFLQRLYTGCPDFNLPGIRQGDALIDETEESLTFGEAGFPEKFFEDKEASFDGFDAIVGNPPYLAAKNESFARYKPYLANSTQADFYLLFIQKYAVRKFLRPGGAICLIVPDPLLLRANAEGARSRLLEGLDLELLLHVKGVFPRTRVANVIFLARRSTEGKKKTVQAVRLEKPAWVRAFRKRGQDSLIKRSKEIPLDYFRKLPRKEFRYLLTPRSMKVLKRLDTARPPFQEKGMTIRPLQSLASAKGAIFRGEEVGKARIRTLSSSKVDGGLPVLLGGENIAQFSIRDDGFFIPPKEVKKDPDRYLRHKIILQKSTGRIVAALDNKGFVVPQSVYAILLDDPRIGYPFLLTQLNSRLFSYFMHVMFTGYKLLQPQIEIEDIRKIPVIVPAFKETPESRSSSLNTAKSLFSQYLRTDDPGWILEYVDDSLKLGSGYGSAMLHDLLDFLGGQMIAACNRSDEEALPRERLEWLIDLVIYRTFGLDLEEIETVEAFFDGGEEPPCTEPEPVGRSWGSFGFIPEEATHGASLRETKEDEDGSLFEPADQ